MGSVARLVVQLHPHHFFDLGLILARNTLKAIKRQADAMENAERARISVEGSRLGSYSFQFDGKKYREN